MSLEELISKSTSEFWKSEGQLDDDSSSSALVDLPPKSKRKSSVLLGNNHDDAAKTDKENNARNRWVKRRYVTTGAVIPNQETRSIQIGNAGRAERQYYNSTTAESCTANAIGLRKKVQARRRSPRLHAATLPTPQVSNNAKRELPLSESFESSISSQLSFRSSHGTTKRSVRPSYEPPSVKRRKLRQSGKLSKSSQTINYIHNSKQGSKDEQPFCPIEASKQCIVAEMKRLEDDDDDHHHHHDHQTTPKPNKNMQLEHLALGLKVWDKTATLEEKKVEAVVAGMAASMELSHLRLTRFLKGDKDNNLSLAQVNNIAKKLEAWLKDV